MRYVLLFTAFLAQPAFAEEEAEKPLLERWAEETMRGLIDEMKPEIENFMDEIGPELEGLFSELIPRLQELTDQLGGLSQYEMPEVLPNGDIIIRRKPSAPPVEIDPGTTAPIEL